MTRMIFPALHTFWSTVSHTCMCSHFLGHSYLPKCLIPTPASPDCITVFIVAVVFMGSEKYPSENGFDAFLKKHGGSDNASTDCERTIFQFDVQNKRFKEALDR